MASPNWIDTHCHLDAAEFDIDRTAALQRARARGVSMIVLPAVTRRNFDTVRELAERESLGYALGIHPLYVDQAHDDDLDHLADALRQHRYDPRLLAVGEIGLDYFVPGLDAARQQRFYTAQLKLARAANLPVILHVRKSADDLLKGLRKMGVRGGIAHAFNGSRQQADSFVGLGFALGFGGAMTFDRALQIRRLAAELPEHALVLETDAPDIPPHWLYRTAAQRVSDATQVATRGATDGANHCTTHGATSRNEPAELPRIAQTLAALRGVPVEDIAALTTGNARRILPGLARLIAQPA